MLPGLELETPSEDELYNTTGRPELTWRHGLSKRHREGYMACSIKLNKVAKRDEKIQKYQELAFEIGDRRQGFKVKIVPVIISWLGGGIRKLTNDLNELFEEKKLTSICHEMPRRCHGKVKLSSKSAFRVDRVFYYYMVTRNC